MADDACIFCAIVAQASPAKAVYEDDDFMAFPDIHPKAKTHILLILKKHIESLARTSEKDQEFLGRWLAVAVKIADQLDLKNGYKIVINTGAHGGQTIGHLHLHILGGEPVNALV